MLNKKISQVLLPFFALSLLSVSSVYSYAEPSHKKVVQNKVDVRLRTARPTNYVVVKGDSLWKIAATFLHNPWIWPQIWDANPQIKNPHKIYPGDVISVVYIDGTPHLHVERPEANKKPSDTFKIATKQAEDKGGQQKKSEPKTAKASEHKTVATPDTVLPPTELKVTKLSPRIRYEKFEETRKPIEASAIESFLISPKIFSAQEYETLPYVIGDNQSRLISGLGNEMYVRGLSDISEYRYNVYHKGETFIDPENSTVLGYEAILVAEARVRRFGDPSTVFITKSYREVLSGDRLVKAEQDKVEHNILPSVSEVEFDGRIIALFDALTQSARNQIVVTNLGQRDGIEVGNVLAVQQHGGLIHDRFDVNEDGDAKPVVIPNINSGIIMIFKVFERVSYGLIMQSSAPIHVNDALTNPQ